MTALAKTCPLVKSPLVTLHYWPKPQHYCIELPIRIHIRSCSPTHAEPSANDGYGRWVTALVARQLRPGPQIVRRSYRPAHHTTKPGLRSIMNGDTAEKEDNGTACLEKERLHGLDPLTDKEGQRIA